VKDERETRKKRESMRNKRDDIFARMNE